MEQEQRKSAITDVINRARAFIWPLMLLPVMAASAAETLLYEAQLPAQLATDPNLCAHAPCTEVMPGADSFSERMGKPPYVEAYKQGSGAKRLVGYVFLSTDIVHMPGYSGKPIVTLIGMDTQGVITGARVLRHSESILRVGIPESKLSSFTAQYTGKFVGDKIGIGEAHQARHGVDAISGATVTTVAQHHMLLDSGIAIASQVGILKPVIRPQATLADGKERLAWDEMVKEGSIGQLTVLQRDIGREGEGSYIDLYFGYLNAPAVGKSVLGEHGFDNLMSQLQPGEHAIFIIANGAESFKGSGFVRGGIYERIRVEQGMDTFIFRDLDYLSLAGIAAKGAPTYCESGVFIIRSDRFSGAYPWSLVFLASKIDKESGTRNFASFAAEYWLPDRYLEGGRPPIERSASTSMDEWKQKTIFLVTTLLLLASTLLYALRGRLLHTKRSSRHVQKGAVRDRGRQ